MTSKCLICQIEFKTYLSRLKRGAGKFCSKSCKWIASKNKPSWNKGLKGVNRGFTGKHSLETRIKISMFQQGIVGIENWRGFKRSIDYLERRKFRQKIQSKIFERDDFTCQICLIRGIDLQVDHIKSWAKFPEERFNMKNCRTLCAKCHYQITFNKPMPDSIRGWGHNLLKGGNLL